MDKIIELQANICRMKFDLLAIRHGFLTTSTIVDDELRLCAFDNTQPDLPTLVSRSVNLETFETEEQLLEFFNTAMEELRAKMVAVFKDRIEKLNAQIENIEKA